MAIIRSISKDKKIKICVADVTDAATEMSSVHGLEQNAKRFFSEVIVNTVLLAADMKEDKATFGAVLKCSKPFNNTVVVCSAGDRIKGYSSCEIDREYDFARHVRDDATLMIINDHGLKNMYSSQVPLEADTLSGCIENYLEISQQHSGLIRCNTNGCCVGVMIQSVLNSEWECVVERKEELEEMSSMILNNRSQADEILLKYGFEILSESEVSFECDCSVERMEEVIISLGKKEAMDTVNQIGKLEITCPYCNKKYEFDSNDIENIFSE